MAMNAALALVLVLNAHLVAGQSGPDLPDDFGKTGNTAAADVAGPTDTQQTPAAVPSITFSRSASGWQLLRTTGTRKVQQPWLVSESWCVNCEAAKARFKAAGNPDSRIITIAEAKRLHGRSVSSIPYEFTIEVTEEVTHLQPPSYRSQNVMQVTLDGSSKPTREAILKHLRGGGPHQGKHWQAWYLESWRTPQLYALHDDDHEGIVPSFDAAEQTVEATISNAPASADAIMAALALHMAPQSETQPAFGSLFNIDIQAPQSMLDLARKLLIEQSWKSEAAGVSMSWAGADRSLGVTAKGITLNPGVSVTLQRGPIKVGTTLRAITYDDSLKWVTLDLVNAPDLTLRFTQ